VVVPVFLLTAVFTLLCHTFIAVPPPPVGLPSSRVILPLPPPAIALLAIPPSTQVTLPLVLSLSHLLVKLPYLQIKLPYFHLLILYYTNFCLRLPCLPLKLPYLYALNVVLP
jgi:hypothetical protein